MRLVLLAALLLAPAMAQHESKAEGGEHGQHLELWKWANFLVLAGGLGYLAAKHGAPFFAARSRQIRKAMVEAEEVRRDAEQRAAEVDARMANLEAEIEALRRESRAEQEAETERLRQQTAVEIGKIRTHAQLEIESAGKAARMELQRHAAELAIGLAKEKIRARMTPQAQNALLEAFLTELERPASRNS
jgi:F-type H+-transporting ATPase subunit b